MPDGAVTSALENKALRPVVADSVEKLLFRSESKNSRLVEASFFLGRGFLVALPQRGLHS
jgi:hypothetical protein